ncbi:hypothetical protein ACFE04_012026 [Oxalis oulophora]
MALYLSRARAINMAQQLKTKICLMGTSTILNHNPSLIVSSSSCKSSSTTKNPFGWRWKSTLAEKQTDLYTSSEESEDNQAIDFPGGKVTYTPAMNFIPESNINRVPCYRVLDHNGNVIPGSDYEPVSKELAVKMYKDMTTLQVMDNIFFEAQRQGRISFYLTSTGEEAISIASGAALSPNDYILPQAMTYRVAHHSTSDDSTKYRPIDEIEYWKNERSPINRFRKWVESNGWWSDQEEAEHRNSIRKQVLKAIQVAEGKEKPALTELFTDVYDVPTQSLNEQEIKLRETIDG